MHQFGMGSNSSRVWNPTGGKNPQMGPRIWDAKKVACALGSPKKLVGIRKGPNLSLSKENIHPSLSGCVKIPATPSIEVQAQTILAKGKGVILDPTPSPLSENSPQVAWVIAKENSSEAPLGCKDGRPLEKQANLVVGGSSSTLIAPVVEAESKLSKHPIQTLSK